MLGRLELAYEQLEGFNADVAHELCTPLATLIGSTELALRKARDAHELREVLGSNLEELQRVASIVHDMLFLSQADRGASARRIPTPSLAALARQVSNYHEAALADAGLALEIVGEAEGSFDTPLLQRALSNLVGNATRYAQRGSTVRVEITGAPGGDVLLRVVNRGAPIAPDHLPACSTASTAPILLAATRIATTGSGCRSWPPLRACTAGGRWPRHRTGSRRSA